MDFEVLTDWGIICPLCDTSPVDQIADVLLHHIVGDGRIEPRLKRLGANLAIEIVSLVVKETECTCLNRTHPNIIRDVGFNPLDHLPVPMVRATAIDPHL